MRLLLEVHCLYTSAIGLGQPRGANKQLIFGLIDRGLGGHVARLSDPAPKVVTVWRSGYSRELWHTPPFGLQVGRDRRVALQTR